LLEDMRKRENWFKEENTNILKHSELDHIFTNRLNNVYDLEDIKEHNLPRPDIDLALSGEHKRPKQNQFSIKQRSRVQLEKINNK
jgi:hypothetical protein